MAELTDSRELNVDILYVTATRVGTTSTLLGVNVPTAGTRTPEDRTESGLP